jgi:hypothetical protein
VVSCNTPATCTNFMRGCSGWLTDTTHVFWYVLHTRRVGHDAAAAAAEVGPARAAAEAIARYVAQSAAAVEAPVEAETESGTESESGAEDEVAEEGNKKIVIAVCAICSTCVNVPYDPSTVLRYDAIEADGVRHPAPVPQDTAIVCMMCFNLLPSSAVVEVDSVLFVCPRCTNLASTALDVTLH